MKKAEREIYLALANEIDWGICGFCRYSEFSGSSCDEGAELYCKHPIDKIGDNCDMGCPGEDCWGFNPKVNVRDTADIIGCILANFDSMKCQWWKEPDGQIKVQGLPKEKIDARTR
jgi:hypothetical protein